MLTTPRIGTLALATLAISAAPAPAQNILTDVLDPHHGTAQATTAPLTFHTDVAPVHGRVVELDAECPAGARHCTGRLELLSVVPARPLAAKRVDFAPGERRVVRLKVRTGLRGERVPALATLRAAGSGALNGHLVTLER